MQSGLGEHVSGAKPNGSRAKLVNMISCLHIMGRSGVSFRGPARAHLLHP